jgi:hypothetical protein
MTVTIAGIMSLIPLLYSLLYQEYINFKITHLTMSDNQNIFKQKPLLLSQYMMNADFINDVRTTSNIDHPSNNTVWKLSSSHSFTSDIFQLAHIYKVFLYKFQSMGILSCRILSHIRPFHDRYCVQWHSKSNSCSKASILSSLFQNYLLHCPHIFNSSTIWPRQYG